MRCWRKNVGGETITDVTKDRQTHRKREREREREGKRKRERKWEGQARIDGIHGQRQKVSQSRCSVACVVKHSQTQTVRHRARDRDPRRKGSDLPNLFTQGNGTPLWPMAASVETDQQRSQPFSMKSMRRARRCVVQLCQAGESAAVQWAVAKTRNTVQQCESVPLKERIGTGVGGGRRKSELRKANCDGELDSI